MVAESGAGVERHCQRLFGYLDLSLCCPRSGQNERQAVVPLMAGLLIEGSSVRRIGNTTDHGAVNVQSSSLLGSGERNAAPMLLAGSHWLN